MIRKIYLSVFVLFAYTSLQAQIISNKKFFKTLPGFKPLAGEYLFIDETEISNEDYKEMLFWYKNKGDSAQYNFLMPDTLVWRDKLAYNEPFVQYYYQHPAYKDYPVVGINYRQAKVYCNWRADRIMEILNLKGTDIEKIMVRLPTEEEWKMAARGTLPETAVFPWEGNTLRRTDKKNKGLSQASFKNGYLNLFDFGWTTREVKSFWPNTLGLYNMAGNVAEWTENKKAMGGSWNDYPYQLRIDYPHEVLDEKTTKSTLGFRCVLEIISFKKEAFKALKLNAKSIEKDLRYIKTDTINNKLIKLFASVYETTNLQYRTFLDETKLSQHQIKNEDWLQHTPYAHMTMYGWHTYYNEFPVVNINYEAAQAYCVWLTNKYNRQTKKEFKKVIFRLPTNEEWEQAASAEFMGQFYAWKGPFYLNKKGEYLGNLSPLEEQYLEGVGEFSYNYSYPDNDSTISRGADGHVFIGKKNSYSPNKFGLYNCTGNVAEMISEKGKSKGGSWNTTQYKALIVESEKYTESAATLGFRVFMQVLE